LAWTSFDVPAKLFTYSNTGGLNREKKIHPTQKPIKLYQYCLKHFANSGDKILDTHLGSGSSRIAAHTMGFDFYGCEINNSYLIDHNRRFQDYISQQNLFI
jgi:site-specific DNA-methyltransferase (adenine-specific)